MSYLVLPWALLSLTIGIAARITMIAIGTLTPRHQRHDAYSVRMPPSTRPIAAPPPAMRAEHAERPGPLLRLGERHRDQRQRGRRQQRGERALQGARGEQQLGAAGEAAERGREREPAEADQQRPLAAGVVGDPTTEQEQAAEGQRVGRDDPLPVGVDDAEVALRRRQRDGHDRRVEDDHQLRQTRSRPARATVSGPSPPPPRPESRCWSSWSRHLPSAGWGPDPAKMLRAFTRTRQPSSATGRTPRTPPVISAFTA